MIRITLLLIMSLIITLVSFDTAIAGRKLVSIDKLANGKREGKLDNFGVVPSDYINDCTLIGLVADINKFNKDYLLLLDGYNNEEKLFHIATTAFGLNLVAKYKIESKKDLCFYYSSKSESALPLYVIKVPLKELKKLDNRDFGKIDIKLVGALNGRPYDLPPYPLIEIFKNSTINELVFPGKNSAARRLEINHQATDRYRKFLNNYQFIAGIESSVEDVYAKYQNMGEEIYQCIFTGDLKCVIGYKKMGFNLNNYPSTKEPLLFTSMRADNYKITNYLLENGANPNITISNNMTPLMLAVVKNDMYLVKLLIRNRADPNKTTDDGVLALDLARYNKFDAIAKYLDSITTAKSQSAASNSSSPVACYIKGEYVSKMGSNMHHSGYCSNSGIIVSCYMDDRNWWHCMTASPRTSGDAMGKDEAVNQACRCN